MLNRLPDAETASLRGIWVSQDTALLLWNSALWPGAFRPSLGKQAISPPFVSVPLPDGEERAGLVRVRNRREGAVLRLGERSPQLPLPAIGCDGGAALASLSAPQRCRLLTLLLDAGLGLLRLVPDETFLRLAQVLAADLIVAASPATPLAAGPFGLRLLSADGPAPAPGGVFLLGPRRVIRIAVTGSSQVFALAEAPMAGELLIGGGEAPWLRKVVPPGGELLPLLDVLAGGGSAGSALASLLPDALARRTAQDRDAAELIQVASLLAPPRPRTRPDLRRPVTATLELALRDPEGGLFLRGWLRDPHRLVAGASLRAGGAIIPVPEHALHRFPRTGGSEHLRRAAHAPGEPGEGFIAYLPDVPPTIAPPELLLSLAGGGTLRLSPGLRTLSHAAARDAVLASLRPEHASEAILTSCIGPAAARFHRAHLSAPRDPALIKLGTQPPRPSVSVIVPLYRNLSFLRAQVAAFAADPAWAEIETIFALDSPEQAAEVEHLLRGLYLMHGLPLTLAVLPRNLGYAAANNVAAGIARAPLLLLLNSDVIPDTPGWIAPLSAAARRAGVAGPKLLFDDGSLQHAGLTFARDIDGLWYNRHFFKGLPRHHAAADRARAVPAVTGAALMARRTLFEAVDGLSEDYVVGDYEDSDLCLKLRRAGATVAYVPKAELWHFERRSIGLHAGYAGTLASLHNRRLHHARWDGAISELMARWERSRRRGDRR